MKKLHPGDIKVSNLCKGLNVTCEDVGKDTLFSTQHIVHPLYLAADHKVIMNDEDSGMTLALAINFSECVICS